MMPRSQRENLVGKRRKVRVRALRRRSTHQKGRTNLLALDCDGYPGRSMWFFATLLPEPSSRAHLLCRLRAMLGDRFDKPMEKQGNKWWHSPAEGAFNGHHVRFRWPPTRTGTHCRDAATGTECQTTSTTHAQTHPAQRGKRRKVRVRAAAPPTKKEE
jgi:hypothetical protein